MWDAATLSISLARTAFAQFSIKLRISLSARAAASGMMRFLISSISIYSIILHAGGAIQNTLDESRFCPREPEQA
jgi:hypothetical protein